MADGWRGHHDEFRVRQETPWPLGFVPPGTYGDDQGWADIKDPQGLMVEHRAETELQAMMEAAPRSAEAESIEAQAELREVIADAIDQLDPRERWVFLANAVEGLGLRTVAAQLSLSKTQTHRILQSARSTLAGLLADYPVVAERLRNDESENDD